MSLVQAGGWIGFHDINDTAEHREYGCQVSTLWESLSGQKFEFNERGEWGGIGVIRA